MCDLVVKAGFAFVCVGLLLLGKKKKNIYIYLLSVSMLIMLLKILPRMGILWAHWPNGNRFIGRR